MKLVRGFVEFEVGRDGVGVVFLESRFSFFVVILFFYNYGVIDGFLS